MAYIHCHSCDWEQDDFYNPNGYNPFRDDDVGHWKELLEAACKGETREMDVWFCQESEMPYKENEDGSAKVLAKDLLINEMKKLYHRIKGMEWFTMEQLQSDPNKVCPKCGSEDLDID